MLLVTKFICDNGHGGISVLRNRKANIDMLQKEDFAGLKISDIEIMELSKAFE